MLQPGHRHYVLSSYRTLLQLIARLPQVQRQSALAEARATCKERKHDTNPEKTLTHLKELAARIGYLRIVTPRRPGDASREAGKFVLRDGKLVEGEGEEKGSRVATGVLSHDEAMRKNAEHFKRFYGADKPKSMFF